MILGIDASRANKREKTGTEYYAFRVLEGLKSVVPPSVTVRLYSPTPLQGQLAILPANWESRVLSWAIPRSWTTLRLSWELLRQPPDALFLPCSGFPAAVSVPVITTIHDVGFDRFPHLYKPIQVWYHRHAVRRALRRAAAIVTISAWTKQELRDVYGPMSVPITIVPLAADESRFAASYPSAEMSRVRTTYELSRPYFVFYGRIEEKKNIAGIVAAYQQYRLTTMAPADLLLIGPKGKGAKELLASATMMDSVRFVPWVPDADIGPLVAGARALVFPTFYEGFGLPILEAFTVGTPVITSRGGAHEEVAGDAALLVPPDDVAAIAAALRRVEDADVAAALKHAGHVRAAGYRWERTARETWSVLERALSRPSA